MRTVISGPFKMERERLTKINSKYDGDSGSYFEVTTSGGAVLDRFAFGKCFITPDSLQSNCTETNSWLQTRGKKASLLADRGAQNIVYTVDCLAWPFNQYYEYIQTKFHAGLDSYKFQCCCADMKTGLPVDEENKCTVLMNTCEIDCNDEYDGSIYQQLYDYQNSLEAEAEEEV